MKSVVKVDGYTRRLNVFAFVKLIRGATGESLAPAKSRVDALLAGESLEVAFSDSKDAAGFCRAAADLGALATQFEINDDLVR
jgi:hypothetical protein